MGCARLTDLRSMLSTVDASGAAVVAGGALSAVGRGDDAAGGIIVSGLSSIVCWLIRLLTSVEPRLENTSRFFTASAVKK